RKRQEEAERKRQEEAERKRQAEEERRRREMLATEQRQRAKDEYVAMIRYAVERNWRRPEGERRGQKAVVFVRQAPGGFIQHVRVEQCDGTPVFCNSVEQAVRRADPLPDPPDPEVFEREIRFVFEPD
ncbi:MAG: cell envelope integrity protein TolA, partial [Ectothiorhodospira sp.]